MRLKYESFEELTEEYKRSGKRISQIVLEDQAQELGRSPQELVEEMRTRYRIMLEAKEEGLKEGGRSLSGLSGKDAHKLYHARGRISVCGDAFTLSLAIAMAVSEHNAAMGRIVAAPTAGSCGILPGVLIGAAQVHELGEDEVVMSMFTASFVGMLVAKKAGVSGAQGGCQAECGTASAMAAAALCELLGGDAESSVHAVAITLKNVLGLVCDPVAGLVEVPCIKRNASGVATALMAAQLALSGVRSVIPADETVLALKRVGDKMCSSLKETAEGGLAATPTGACLCQCILKEHNI